MGFKKVKLPPMALQEKVLNLNWEILLQEPWDSPVKTDILVQVLLLQQGLDSFLRANNQPYLTVDQETSKINPDTQKIFKYSYALNMRAEILDHKSPLLTIYYEDFLYPTCIGFDELVWEEIKMQDNVKYHHIDSEKYYIQAKSESAFLVFLDMILETKRIKQVIDGISSLSAHKAISSLRLDCLT